MRKDLVHSFEMAVEEIRIYTLHSLYGYILRQNAKVISVDETTPNNYQITIDFMTYSWANGIKIGYPNTQRIMLYPSVI